MAVIRLAQAAPVISYPTSYMPIASLFRSAARPWRSLSAVLLASATAAFAQFPSAADGFDPNLDGNVYAVAQQPDGKLILAGQFSLVRPNGLGGTTRNNLARFNPDGTVDASFDPNTNGAVRAVMLQPDGKILVGGDFTTLQPNGAATATTRNRLARLNADGTLDVAFNPNIGGTTPQVYVPQVFALLLQADGRIVVGGNFTSVTPTPTGPTFQRNRLARLNADGSLDAAFDPNANNLVFALAQHGDGKIVVAGGFTSFQANGATTATTRNRIARLNSDGTPDSDFDPNFDNRATALAIQRDGKILVGGDFSLVQPIGTDPAVTHNRLVRLNVDGTLDTAFTGNASGNIAALAVQPDGSILAGGSFTTVWSASTTISNRAYLARFKPDGNVDLTFYAGMNSIVDAFAFQPDGKLVIAGAFTALQPVGSTASILRNRVARLNPNGSLDATFNLDAAGRPLVEAVQKDGKLVIGGSFTSVGGATHNHLARLNPDGSVDPTFNPNLNGLVLAMVIQPDDQKIIVGGTFTTIGGETRNYIARLNADGTLDSGFDPNANAQITAVALQSNGRILLGGAFVTLQPNGAAASSTRTFVARLNADGTLDTAFHPNTNATVRAIAVQSDGKILLGGSFSSLTANVDVTPVVSGTTTTIPTGTVTPRNSIARVNADGSIDAAFDPNLSGAVNTFALQSDGKIIVGGEFTALRPNGATTTVVRNHLARLNTDGTVDSAYDPNVGNLVLTTALQADGKLLVGGPFISVQPAGDADWTLRKYAARLETTGKVDTTFNLDLNELSGNRVDSWLVLSDGRILIGGAFTSLQPIGATARVPRNHFARLNANGTLDTAFLPGVGGTTTGQINTLVVQPDGKLIAAGSFADIGGTTTTNIARFNPEGTPDVTFSPALGADGPINAVLVRPGAAAVTPQGKGLAWLNADGTFRASFSPGADSRISGTIDSFAVQPDGGVIVGGTFTTPTGIPGPNLVRFAPNGALDPNFSPNPNGAVEAIVVQPDGRILVGGTFTNIVGSERDYVARLNADGTLDNAFNPQAGARVNAIVLQADGKIVIGGVFTTLNPNATITTTTTTTTTTPTATNGTTTTNNANGGTTTTTVSTTNGVTTTTVVTISSAATTRNYLARLNADGTIDTAYNPSAGGTVNALVFQPDGKLIVGGTFTSFQPGGTGTPVTRNNLARLNSDGTVDASYDPNANGLVNALALYVDGKVIAGGAFTTLQPNSDPNTYTRNHIARVNTDGTLDQNFDPNTNGNVTTIAVQPDSKILFGGAFTTVQPNGATVATTRNHVARVDFSGALDTGFDPNADGNVNALFANSDGSVLLGGAFATLQPNAPLIVGGAFNTIGGATSRAVALLGDDGSVSSLFQPSPNGNVNALLMQSDGKFVVAGDFTNIAGATRNRIARFNTDFTLDAAFKPTLNDAVNTLALQPDGKLVIGGLFTTVNGTPCITIARLNADGSLDSTFTGAGFFGITGIVLQPDGRMLVFGTGSGVPSRLLRLNADGSLDATFSAATGGNPVTAVALQTDGRILVGGRYTTYLGAPVAPVVRLNSNGSLDATFNPAPDGAVTALVVQTDGRLVIAGNFTSVGGLPRGGLARLAATTPAAQAVTATSTSAVWARSGASPELSSVTFEQSADALYWAPLGTAGRVSGTANWQLNGLSLPPTGLFYLRARGVTPSGAGTSSGVVESLREFNLAAIPGVGPASSSVATLEIGGVLLDAATGLVTGQLAPGAGASAAMTNAPIGVVAAAVAPTTTIAGGGDARLINFSARALVNGGSTIISGFVITGSQSHAVLLRAVGPSLGLFGVNGVLAAPRLQLCDAGDNVVLQNQGWTTPASGLPALVAAMTGTGAFPLVANSSDAAAIVTLPPGAYSMQILDSAGGPGGVTLAEVYDAGSPTDSSRLMNISLRGNVNPGSGAFISGFVLRGNAPKSLLIRGIGPSLTQFNVPGALADPIVSVFTGTGQLLASNDNWSQTTSDGLISANTAALTTAARSVGAFPLAIGSKDAALSLTLVPGTYAVQVTGAGGVTGTALIEVYELP